MCTLVGMAERKGKPLSDADKVARDRAEKALKEAKTEQAGEEAGLSTHKATSSRSRRLRRSRKPRNGRPGAGDERLCV
jgi:hypothetical protein